MSGRKRRRRRKETPAEKLNRKAVWLRRRRRVVTGFNVLVAVALMGVVMVLANALAARLPLRLQLQSRARHALSEKTMGQLRGMDARIDVVALFDFESRLYDDVTALLREYAHAAESIPTLEFNLEVVDPQRDIARTRELAQKYDLESGNQIVFVCGETRKIIDINELARYEIEIKETGVARRMVGFLGEQAFSSALLNVTEKDTPVIYFLTGHGERDIEDFGRQAGYSTIARAISRDNMDVRRLQLAEHDAIPADCRALVVAGPDRKLSEEELKRIDDYLMNRHGRVLLLLDPGVQTGLEVLLEKWGVQAGAGVVAGLTFSGRELVVTEYGDHPVTRNFKNVTTMFYMPRPMLKLENGETSGEEGRRNEDRVRVSVLAGTGPEGWIESDLAQEPPKFDRDVDVRGPVPVALAVERGPVGINVELQPTRMVAIGDSYFISNAAISSGVGGNVSFLMSALNWLVERDSLLTVEPRVPVSLELDMTSGQWNRTFGLLVFGLPGLVALCGALVALRRRR